MDKANFSTQINAFNSSLSPELRLPEGIEVLNPFTQKKTRDLASKFYLKYYNDRENRKILLGINPGRLGAGLTGIPFTDPVKLQERCGIQNDFKKVGEPSAGFIYDMIDGYGSIEDFYKHFFIYSVCPLGFTKNGINYNYYDSSALTEAVTPFIIASLKKIITFHVNTEICYCIGNGKNYKFLKMLNKQHHFFETLVPLPHPRWVAQYRRKRYQEYIDVYLHAIKS